MRITLATTAPDVGGVSRHLFDLAQASERRGHDVVVASRRDASRLRAAVHDRGLSWQPLDRSVLAPAEVWHLHLHNTLDARALPLLECRRRIAHGAVILTEHLPRVPRTDISLMRSLPPTTRHGFRKPGATQLKPKLKRAQYRVADAVIAVSRSSADFVSRRWKADRKWITTIHNGVAVPMSPPPLSTGGPRQTVVVAVGALHWLKGFDVLLTAATHAREPWSICIVGDGQERQSLEAQAARLSSVHHVEFIGWQEDAARIALQGDLVCAPSRAEAAASYVVLEAMACARAVIASDVDGADEAILSGQNGLLVPPDDPRRLASAIDELARDRDKRVRMGQAAYARAASDFGLSRMVDATLAVYENARAQRGATASRGHRVRIE